MLQDFSYQQIIVFLSTQEPFSVTDNDFGNTFRFYFEKEHCLIFYNLTRKEVSFRKSRSQYGKMAPHHRTDGPAILFEDGKNEYHIDGELMSKFQWSLNHEVQKNKLKSKINKL